jgi:hypothetical protein
LAAAVLAQQLLHLEIQIEEQTVPILFSAQSHRLAAVAADLEPQDNKQVLPQGLVVVDLKTQVEAQEIHQQHHHHKELVAVLVARAQRMTAAAAAAAGVLEPLAELVLERLGPVQVETELHQILLRAVQLSLMLVAEVAVAHIALAEVAVAVLVELAAVVKDVISHPRRSLVQQALEQQI